MLHLSSAAAFPQTSHSIMRSSLFGFSSSWKRSVRHAGIKVTKLDILLMRFPVQCYSTRRAPASRLPKSNPGPSMEEESKAFYVVRKGDIIGIYKNLDDCQTQVSSSVSLTFIYLFTRTCHCHISNFCTNYYAVGVFHSYRLIVTHFTSGKKLTSISPPKNTLPSPLFPDFCSELAFTTIGHEPDAYLLLVRMSIGIGSRVKVIFDIKPLNLWATDQVVS